MTLPICPRCNRPCRNRCTKCSRPWCANCRDATGYATCETCRNKQKAARIASQVASIPVYMPSQPVSVPTQVALPNQGLALSEMAEGQRYDWLVAAVKGLKEKIESDQNYLSKRAGIGKRTPTDVLMNQHMTILRAVCETLEAELDTLMVPQPLQTPGYAQPLARYPTNPMPKP